MLLCFSRNTSSIFLFLTINIRSSSTLFNFRIFTLINAKVYNILWRTAIKTLDFKCLFSRADERLRRYPDETTIKIVEIVVAVETATGIVDEEQAILRLLEIYFSKSVPVAESAVFVLCLFKICFQYAQAFQPLQ